MIKIDNLTKCLKSMIWRNDQSMDWTTVGTGEYVNGDRWPHSNFILHIAIAVGPRNSRRFKSFAFDLMSSKLYG